MDKTELVVADVVVFDQVQCFTTPNYRISVKAGRIWVPQRY